MSMARHVGGVMGMAVLLATGLTLLAGCGGTETPDVGKGTTSPKASAKAAAAAPETAAPRAAEKAASTVPAKPTEAPPKRAWADRVFEVYESALRETNGALEKTPPAAEGLPKLQAIRDKAVEALVPLGREREALDTAARAEADRQLRMKIMIGFESTETYKAYAKLFNEVYNITKMKTDEEKAFQKLLAGMNIITQYASFELLKKQEPKEAERLGIQ